MRTALLLTCVLALVLAAPAAAKGPDRATLTGPGLDRPLVFSGYGSDGRAPLGVLTQQGGFWVHAFGISAGRVDQGRALAAKPAPHLGPRYLVVYRLPGPRTPSLVRQALYPYAATPVSYMPKQRFWQTRTAPGGWYRWGPNLKVALIGAGLPATAPERGQPACSVSKATLPSGRYGTSRLRVTLPPGGILRVQRNQPDDGLFGTKIGWIPDLDRASTGKGSWASAVAFPAGGCWRITGRAGPAAVSFVVRVVTEG